jgi:hypothetical protein
MKLSQAVVNDEVVLFGCIVAKDFAVSLVPSSFIFSPGKVIAITKRVNGTTDYLVAWKDFGLSDVPRHGTSKPYSNDIKLYPALNTYDLGGWFRGEVEVFKINGSTAIGKAPLAATPEEKPCLTCSRPNYLNEKNCWSCGNHPFK